MFFVQKCLFNYFFNTNNYVITLKFAVNNLLGIQLLPSVINPVNNLLGIQLLPSIINPVNNLLGIQLLPSIINPKC